ncbi:MAG: hypothetical protein DI617_08475 [Streptococcus pyogenes]|nr:MAG: hypothetical protein DI617_08475 [Streptococcus pyogenes]
MTGLAFNRKKTKIHFMLTFVGVNLCFYPQHFLGLSGIPRRYDSYPDHFIFFNYLSSIGSLIRLIRTLFMISIFYDIMTRKKILS